MPWKRSPVGNEWKSIIKGKDGKIKALLSVQKHGGIYYWQSTLASGGLPNGKSETLADAKSKAEKSVKP